MAASKAADAWDEGWDLDDDEGNEEAGLLAGEEEAIQQLRLEPIQTTSLVQQQYRYVVNGITSFGANHFDWWRSVSQTLFKQGTCSSS